MLENKRKSRQNDDFAKCGWGGWNISEYCCKFLKNNNKNCKILRIFPAKVSHGFISCFGLSQAIVFGLFSLL